MGDDKGSTKPTAAPSATRRARLANPPAPNAPTVPVAPPAPAIPTGDAAVNSVFDQSYDLGGMGVVPTQRSTATNVQAGWNAADASVLQQGLNTPDDWKRLVKLPSPDEMLDQMLPRLPGTVILDKPTVTTIAEALAKSGEDHKTLRAALGLSKLPSALAPELRSNTSGTKQMTEELVKTIKKADANPAYAAASPRVQAEIAARMDAIAGLSLVRAKNYELQIMTKGATTPKGQVLARYNKALIAEAQKQAQEINRALGLSTVITYDKLGRGKFQDPTSPGAQAYAALMGGQGSYHFNRAEKIKAGVGAALDSLNNN